MRCHHRLLVFRRGVEKAYQGNGAGGGGHIVVYKSLLGRGEGSSGLLDSCVILHADKYLKIALQCSRMLS